MTMVSDRVFSRLRELLRSNGTDHQRAAEEGRWEQLLRSGEQTVVDHMAPSVLVEEPDCFQVGDVWGRAYFVADLPPGVLTARERLILHLIFDRDMDAAEAGAVLGISPQTVRSTKHKAVQKLREHFKVKDST